MTSCEFINKRTSDFNLYLKRHAFDDFIIKMDKYNLVIQSGEAITTHSDFFRLYKDNIGIDFTYYERTKLRKATRIVLSKVKKSKISQLNPSYFTNWSFIKASGALNFGYVYTIGTSIVIPSNKIASMKINDLAKLLTHEQIHIMQRVPEIMTELNQLYLEKFKFIQVPNRDKGQISSFINQSYTSITNPDGLQMYGKDVTYVADGFGIAVFKAIPFMGIKHKEEDIKLYIVLCTSGYTPIHVYLIDDFIKKQIIWEKTIPICRTCATEETFKYYLTPAMYEIVKQNSYHPNEIYAEFMAKTIFEKI